MATSADCGDYIVYADESGDHGSVSSEYPVFILAFCIFKKSEYAAAVTTALTNLKFKWFGHDAVILHEREIRKQQAPFEFLARAEQRNAFMEDLTKMIDEVPFTLIATVIRKDKIVDAKAKAKWPVYPTAMQFNLERLAYFLRDKHETKTTHIIFERRGKKEDDELELEFHRRAATATRCNGGGPLSIVFSPKASNHCGHQLADLIARPIGQSILRPGQTNRALEVIEGKFRRSGKGSVDGYGRKVFP